MFTTPSEKYIHQITFNFFFQTLKLNSLQYDTFNTLSEMLIIHVVSRSIKYSVTTRNYVLCRLIKEKE